MMNKEKIAKDMVADIEHAILEAITETVQKKTNFQTHMWAWQHEKAELQRQISKIRSEAKMVVAQLNAANYELQKRLQAIPLPQPAKDRVENNKAKLTCSVLGIDYRQIEQWVMSGEMLSPRETGIIAMRFGLFDGNPQTVKTGRGTL